MSQPSWQLSINQGPNAGSTYPLRGRVITIGRSPDNSIVIDDSSVSRHHARLTWQGHAYALEDLGSSNGTWVNNARIKRPVLLNPGDSIGVGQSVSATFGSPSGGAAYAATRQVGGAYAAGPSGRSNRAWIVAAVVAVALIVAVGALAYVLLIDEDDAPPATSVSGSGEAVVVVVATETSSPPESQSGNTVVVVVASNTPDPSNEGQPGTPPTYTPYPTYTPVPTDPPTYTPYPTYTPRPTDQPTYTPYPTNTPYPTQKPPPPAPAPTNAPPPTRQTQAPYTIAINKVEPEPWGRPRAADGCNGPYNDRDPVKRFTIEVILTNNSNQWIADGWAPTFYSAAGQIPPTCVWYYDNQAVQPGEVIYVTFATHVESNDWVRAMVFDELGYQHSTCFNAGGQVVGCR